jgi:hypothetical protein
LIERAASDEAISGLRIEVKEVVVIDGVEIRC